MKKLSELGLKVGDVISEATLMPKVIPTGHVELCVREANEDRVIVDAMFLGVRMATLRGTMGAKTTVQWILLDPAPKEVAA